MKSASLADDTCSIVRPQGHGPQGGRGVEVEVATVLVDEVMISADLGILLVDGERSGGCVHWPGRGTARGANLDGHANLGSRCAAI
jgi:hypothetical protein